MNEEKDWCECNNQDWRGPCPVHDAPGAYQPVEAWEEAIVDANRMLEDFEDLLNEAGIYLEYGEGSLANQLEAWRSRVTELGVSGMPTDDRAQ